MGGGAAVLAAAGLVTAFVLVGDSDESVSTPATDPTPVPTTTPTTPAPTTTPPQAADAGVVLTAGPEGVVEHRGATSRSLSTEPMEIALDAWDGRVIVQRRGGDGTGRGWTDADTVPLVLGADGSLTELLGTADWDGGVVLHDVEVVDGRRLLLYSLQIAMEDPAAANETLYVVDIDTQDRTEVATAIFGWEPGGTGRLHLATNGLIVGEYTDVATAGPAVVAVPGSPAEALLAVPSSAPLGWDPSSDCADCQRAYTVAPDGRSVAWLEGDELVTAEIDGLDAGNEQRYPLDPGVPTANVRDLDFNGSTFVVSYWLTDPLPSPVVLPADFPSAPPTTLEGQAATLAPSQSVFVNPSPPTTVPPATTVPSAPQVDRAAVVTAGPEGVVEHRDGESRTLTTEAMAIALGTGDGRVITQSKSGHSPNGSWTDPDTVPLELEPDGSLATLFGGADWDDATRLHDIEVVDGRRLLLYSRVREQVPQEANEDLYVADLATGERTLVSAGVGGWEFGTGRLHLASTGLVVGEWQSEASHGLAIHFVPGSPAADTGVPTPADLGLGLGLEESYSDCADCPYTFTVTSDGATIAWIADGQLVATSLTSESGEAEPIVAVPPGTVADVDLAGEAAVLSFFGTEQAPVIVPLDGSDPVALEGVTAALSPNGEPAAPPEPSPETTVPAATVPPPLDTGPACGFDPQAPAITDHVGEVPPAFEGYVWTYQGDSNYDPCAALSYTRGSTPNEARRARQSR